MMLSVYTTSDANSPLLEAFYATYANIFTLANESETLEGFQECLQLNDRQRYAPLHERIGPFREFATVIWDEETQKAVAGANYFCLSAPHPRTHVIQPELEARPPYFHTVHLNYVFVAAHRRGEGLMRKALHAAVMECRAFLHDEGQDAALPMLVFFEQNDPEKMTPEQYEQDTLNSGIDQKERMRMWAKLGARRVDFPYVQPPLSADQEPDETLSLCVMLAEYIVREKKEDFLPDTLSGIPPHALYNHLYRFFAVSVLKNKASPETVAVCKAQFALLRDLMREEKEIPLITRGGNDGNGEKHG